MAHSIIKVAHAAVCWAVWQVGVGKVSPTREKKECIVDYIAYISVNWYSENCPNSTIVTCTSAEYEFERLGRGGVCPVPR